MKKIGNFLFGANKILEKTKLAHEARTNQKKIRRKTTNDDAEHCPRQQEAILHTDTTEFEGLVHCCAGDTARSVVIEC